MARVAYRQVNSDHLPHRVGQGTRVVSAGVIPATVVSRHKLATLAGMTFVYPADTPDIHIQTDGRPYATDRLPNTL